MISKEKFVELMGLLRDQYDLDVANSEHLREVFGESVVYDNGNLFKAVVGVLSEGFDADEVGHWIWERQFGKFWDGEGDVFREEIGAFWERLSAESLKLKKEKYEKDIEWLREISPKSFEVFINDIQCKLYPELMREQAESGEFEDEKMYEEINNDFVRRFEEIQEKHAEKKPQSGTSFSNGGAQLMGIEGAFGDVGKKSLRDDVDKELREEPWLDFRSDLTRGLDNLSKKFTAAEDLKNHFIPIRKPYNVSDDDVSGNKNNLNNY